MNRFLANNLPWKIVSLILATILWVFVINTQNPILQKVITDLPVDIQGLEQLESKGFIVTNLEEIKAEDIKIVVKGPRLEMEEVMGNGAKLEIRLDLTSIANTLNNEDLGSTEKLVRVQVIGEKGALEIEEIKPATISVSLDKESKEIKEVEPNIQGGINSEYMTQDPVIKPNTVQIVGPETKVNKVERVVVDVNVDDFSEDVLKYKVPVKLLDKNGDVVPGVKAEPEQVEVLLAVGKIKQVPLEAQFQGKLPNGYIKSNVIITPEELMVVGSSAIIDQIDKIKLEPITLDNMIQSDTFQVNVVLPQGVERMDTTDIVVTVEIQKEIPYEYTIDTTQLKLDIKGLPSIYEMKITQPTISVSLLGTPENLLGFNAKDVQAILDLNQLSTIVPGTYAVPLRIEIPSNLKIVAGEGEKPLTLDIEIIDPNEEVFDEENEEGLEENGSSEGNEGTTEGNTDKPLADEESNNNEDSQSGNLEE